MNSDLLEIEDDDDTLLLNDAVPTTAVDFCCSPLIGSNPTKEDTRQDEKENVKLSVERQKMKRKKKGFNLRKSLAWNHAFFTDQGVLDPTELSMLTGGLGASGEEMLSVIDEGSETLSGDMEGDLHDLPAGDDNLLKDLPSSSVKKGQKTTRNIVSTPVSGSCGKEKKLNSASAVKRKVLSAHDINRSALKRNGGPLLSVPSSSFKRSLNLNTKAVKDPKVSKLSTVKSDKLVANRSLRTAANLPKCNQKALPAINPKTNVGIKDTFTNTKGSTSNVRSGLAGKRNLKSSIRPARNVVRPVAQSSTNAHNLTVDVAKTDIRSAVSVDPLAPNGHNASTGRITSFSQSSGYSSANMRQAQPQAAKPSGLRMPSPSLRFFDQSKPAGSHGLLQKNTQLVRPSESGTHKSKVGGLNQTLQRPRLPSGKIPAVLDSGNKIVLTSDLNSSGKLKSNSEVNNVQKVDVKFPHHSQHFDEEMYERPVHDVCDVGPQSQDVAGLAGPSKVKRKDAKSNNNKLLTSGTNLEPLKKDDAREALSGNHLITEFILCKTDIPNLMSHISHPIKAKGLPETSEICIDTHSIDMNNSRSTFSSEDRDNLPGRIGDVEEQPEELAKLTETDSFGVHSVSSMNNLTLEVDGLSQKKGMTLNQIYEDTQSIDMDICSENGISEEFEDLPGKIHGVDERSDEKATLMDGGSREVCPISSMNNLLLPANDDILFENAHPEELSKCRSLEVADGSVKAKICTPSNPEFSCSPSNCKDVECKKDETTGMDNVRGEVQQDVGDAPVLCLDDNLVKGSGKNTLSTSAADNSFSMIMDDLGASEYYQDTDSCQAAQFVMSIDTDLCESELKKMNNHLVVSDALSGMYAEDECSNTYVVTEEEKALLFEDQQDNNASSVQSISLEETNSYKDELKSPSTLGSTPLFEQDCGVDMNGEVCLYVESAPSVSNVKQVVQIIKHQHLDEASSLGLERTDEDNPLVTSQRCPALVVNDPCQGSTLIEQDSDFLVLHNGCSTDSDMANGIQLSVEQDKMITTDEIHATKQEKQSGNAYDGLFSDDGRSIEDSLKAENVITSEKGAAGASGWILPRGPCELQKTEEASRLTVKETPMENVQGEPSHESLLADSCKANISSSVESTDYLMVPEKIHEEPEEHPMLEYPDHMIGQIYEESHKLSSHNYLLPREISNVEEAQKDDVPSGGHDNALDHSNSCSTEPKTLNNFALQTPAMQGSGLEVDRKTESMVDMKISGFLEVESSVENVDLVMVGECEEDGKHRSQETLEFESSLKNESQDSSAENCIDDKVDNDTSTTDAMQGVKVDLLDCKTSEAEDETHVVEDRTNQSNIQYEMDNTTEDKDAPILFGSMESVNEKTNEPVKPPPHAVPFSDEWLAAFEAAGEEILTMKSGAVQNSPPDKFQPEPSPWSPVKKKNNQGIGPYDCTKFTNTGIPPSTSS